MNQNVMFSSKTDLWETPQDLFDKYDAIYHFETDVCALPNNAKCARYYTPEMDGLKQTWNGACWCNPPVWKKHRNVGRKGGYVKCGCCHAPTGAHRYAMVP